MTGFISLDRDMKMSQTEKYVFFLNGPFSQWYPSTFETFIFSEDATVFSFNCAEQYMMAAKAKLFEDEETFAKIMAVEQDPKDWRAAPRKCKELGREVKNFDDSVWTAVARTMVGKGNFAKFSQNKELRDFLLATEDKVLVEGAYYDKIWGVGLAWDDVRITDPANWKGKNWLGETLMVVREAISNGDYSEIRRRLRNIEPDYNEMRLPEGKSCGDCAHVNRCLAFGFTSAVENTLCDFWPSRFREQPK